MRPASRALDLLDNHRLEAAVGVARFGQQVRQPTVARDRYVESFVCKTEPALFEILA
ncbi:MAG: hypothetical protein J2P17_16705 [Mycobacterium sp.]|nr:hypothetical protein [Mycobacterium sp.]